MIYYKEHRKQYIEYLQKKAMCDEIIDEYSVAFQKTQPHSPSYSGVQYSGIVNRVEEYVIEIERKNLKRRAESAKKVLDAKRYLLDLKEAELRKSFDIYDVLYVAKWIDHKSTKDIIHEIGRMGICYSTSQIYAILKQMKCEIGLTA